MMSSQYRSDKKRDFSFASPSKDESTIIKANRSLYREFDSPTQNKRTNQYYSNNEETFRINTERSRAVLAEDLQALNNEHVAEVQKLLLQISRLHELVRDMQKQNLFEVQKVRDCCENQTYLHVSSLKQTHAVKIENLQIQLRKAKEQIDAKDDQCRELQKKAYRQKESLYLENQRLKNQIKALIEKKNNEIFNIKIDNQRELNKRAKQNESKIQEIKDDLDEQIERLRRIIDQKSRAKDKAEVDKKFTEGSLNKLMQELQNQKQELKRNLAINNLKANQRCEAQRSRLTEIMNHELQNAQKTADFQVQMLKDEINRIMDILRQKDQQIDQLMILSHKKKLSQSIQLERYQSQNAQLRERIGFIKNKEMQELQILKVKLAALHEADIRELVSLYETRIEGLASELKKNQQQTSRLRAYLHEQIHKKYQMKKKYDIAISRLNSKILQLKTGMNSMENELKDKLENQRSIMLLTSKSFIKQTELKNNNVKFYEEELRKLRQLLDVQAMETAVSQKNVEQKIKMAEQELARLTNKIIKIKEQNNQSEKRYKEQIEQKDQQIRQLNQDLNLKRKLEQDDAEGGKTREIDQLKASINDKIQKIKLLEDRCYELQTKLSLCKAELQQMKIDTQINSQQAKDRYEKIADATLKQIKNHYERRVHQLQADKQELQKINSSQMEKITQLIQRYNQLEHGMNQMVRQSKKLTELEKKIIHLGTDNNLVKNMAELFRNETQV